ncbi:protein translocase subunit secF [Alkalispirochaeta americana]|uniref:Protein-export membrane protein SecF n=1 Tax=Alkalispirochaeta americana TaxID=159291 RepID=A0A1N6VAK1_9SPIO|nr:protein translocase subunit SecF [Alkalispirochaeta americana]SIQ74901.1 protein translocase subunit secF [Alkalispirochaeta americana]
MTRVFDFMKSRLIMMLLSAVVIVGGIAGTVVQGGFNLGIDFRAGLSMTVGISGDVSEDDLRAALTGFEGAQVQRLGAEADQRFVIRVRDEGTDGDDVQEGFAERTSRELLDVLAGAFPASQVEELETVYVGPRFSRDLTQQALFLTVFALLLILAYLWFRFRLEYAASSIVALLHDVVVILGVIGTLQMEVSTATIAAVLTIIGYSLNDTIVIFDRIRENEVLLREKDFRTVINTSITQSLSRTIITSVTTLLAVGAIYIFSTGAIQLFALTLIIGVLVGTYSSVFVASPVLFFWHIRAGVHRRRKDAERYHRGAVSRSSEGETTKQSGAKAAQAAVDRQAADAEAAKREILQKRRGQKKKGGH